MQYWYKALKKDKVVTATIESNSPHEVVFFLKRNGYIPIEIKKVESIMPKIEAMFNQVNFTDVVDFTRQLAIMLNAGLTLIDCFNILEKQIKKPGLLSLMQNINKDIMSGNTFSSALQKYPQYFPGLYVSLVKSGEASGKLSDILLKLAENLEKEREFRSKIKSALAYPVIVVIGMILVMFVMITFVIPKLLNMYEDFDVELPVTTQILITISDVSRSSGRCSGRRLWSLFRIQKISFNEERKACFRHAGPQGSCFRQDHPDIVLVDATRTLVFSSDRVFRSLTVSILLSRRPEIWCTEFVPKYLQTGGKRFFLRHALGNEGIYPPIPFR
jgi:type II secretory pathway component PulF